MPEESINRTIRTVIDGAVDALKEHARRAGAQGAIVLEEAGKALAEIAKVGFDPVFGARPLKRAIQKYIEDPLSEKILLGEFTRTEEIEVDVAPEGDRLAFRALTGSTKS